MGKFNDNTRAKDALDDPRVAALLDEYVPGILEHPGLWVAKTFTLKRVYKLRNAIKSVNPQLTDQKIEEFFVKLYDLQ